MLVEVAQLAGVEGEDGATGSVVERQYGIQVVLAHVADGKGHSLLRNDGFGDKVDQRPRAMVHYDMQACPLHLQRHM
ncbi:hypothetical protein GCM10008098_04920 [Rhodanobacter panaciterrae]|uniref:Uncharacterized protein n=1 Tax=Rhodanobacter panaciterrae TaxID=490572 RepID=A0ABQ2ZLP2_9GAMM|nr:hypothetical protein GCM10008098_04920 [Rhodanobacter panaciterrae]